MKASTLFGITLAVLLGLGAVVAAKLMGVFRKDDPLAPPNGEPPKILIAKRNLYVGVAITPDQVQVRPLQRDELPHYQQNKEKYLPPFIDAALVRIPNRNIEAGTPLLKEDLQDLTRPEGYGLKLKSGMLGVHVAVPKERCAGGLIQVGERVNVLMTCTIAHSSGGPPTTRSAYIARNLRVVFKRSNLVVVQAPLPADQPVDYDLEANPYRTALIQYAQSQGQLSLMPAPDLPDARGSVGEEVRPPDGVEYRDEEQRIEAVNSGELVVGEADLERIFKLKPPPPPKPPVVVEHVSGVQRTEPTVFDNEGKLLSAPSGGGSGRDKDKASPSRPSGGVRPAAAEPTGTPAKGDPKKGGSAQPAGPALEGSGGFRFQAPEAPATQGGRSDRRR